MPQLHLPLFPSGATEITATLSFCKEDDTVTYFHCGERQSATAKHKHNAFLKELGLSPLP